MTHEWINTGSSKLILVSNQLQKATSRLVTLSGFLCCMNEGALTCDNSHYPPIIDHGKERGNYHIHAHLSSIQHKDLALISLTSRNLHLAFLEAIMIPYYMWVIYKLPLGGPLFIMSSLSGLTYYIKNLTPHKFPGSSLLTYTRLIQGLQSCTKYCI